jgi:hypothetical protein
MEVTGELSLSHSDEVDALSDSYEAQFQPVNKPLDPAIIEMENEAMRSYECASTSEP